MPRVDVSVNGLMREVSYIWRSERVARNLLHRSLSSCSIEMEPSIESAWMVFSTVPCV